MARIVIGRSASVTASLDNGVERIYRRAIERVAPGLLDRLERELDDLEAGARDDWPVKTGFSRGRLRSLVLVSPDHTKLRGTLLNDAPYARFIKGRKLPGSGSAFVELMRKPLRARKAALAQVFGELAARELRGVA